MSRTGSPARTTRLLTVAPLLLAACQATDEVYLRPVERAVERGPARTLRGVGGLRALDSDWAPADAHTTFGLEYAQRLSANGHGFELGFLFGSDSGERTGLDVDSKLRELYAGYHAALAPLGGGFLPTVGAGVSWFDGEITVAGARDESKSDFGLYVQASLGAWVGERVLLSFGGRYVTGAKLDFEAGSDLNVSGIMPFVAVGVGF